MIYFIEHRIGCAFEHGVSCRGVFYWMTLLLNALMKKVHCFTTFKRTCNILSSSYSSTKDINLMAFIQLPRAALHVRILYPILIFSRDYFMINLYNVYD